MAKSVVGSVAIAFLLVLVLRTTCAPPDIPRAYQAFFELPDSLQRDSLRTYLPADQIEIYLLAPRVSPPGYLDFASVVAANGPDIMPSILHKLAATEQHNADIELLLQVLETMVCEHGHSFTNDTLVMRVSADAAARAPGNTNVSTSINRIQNDCEGAS